jgi:hypothetical protein
MKILLECANYQLIEDDAKNYIVDTSSSNISVTKLLTKNLSSAVSYFTSLTTKKDHVSAN